MKRNKKIKSYSSKEKVEGSIIKVSRVSNIHLNPQVQYNIVTNLESDLFEKEEESERITPLQAYCINKAKILTLN